MDLASRVRIYRRFFHAFFCFSEIVGATDQNHNSRPGAVPLRAPAPPRSA